LVWNWFSRIVAVKTTSPALVAATVVVKIGLVGKPPGSIWLPSATMTSPTVPMAMPIVGFARVAVTVQRVKAVVTNVQDVVPVKLLIVIETVPDPLTRLSQTE
jgi:hypothetical protein